MFNYSQPHSAYSYMQRRNESSNLLADAANKGIALLDKQVDYQLLIAFQNYIISVLNLVSQKWVEIIFLFIINLTCLLVI